jgi:hypothetical protein
MRRGRKETEVIFYEEPAPKWDREYRGFNLIQNS